MYIIMLKNQHKFKGQSILGDLEGFIEHPLDTLEGKAKKVEQFVIHPIDSTKSFFNDTENSAKNFITNPLNTFESGLSDIKNEITEIPRALNKGVNNLETFANTIESGIETVRDDLEIGSKWAWAEAKLISGEVYDAGKSVYSFGRNTISFAEHYYKLILLIGLAYTSARVYNEIKATKLI